MNLLNFLVVVVLSVAPGLLFQLLIRDENDANNKIIILGIALSPISLIIIDLFVPFSLGAFKTSIIKAISFLLLISAVLRIKKDTILLKRLGFSLICTLIIFTPVLAVTIIIPGWREMGWHNLIQLETIYSVAETKLWNMDMAFFGKIESYPWVGLLPLRIISQTIDLSPTLVFLVINFIYGFSWIHCLASHGEEGLAFDPSFRITNMSKFLSIMILFLGSGVSVFVLSNFPHFYFLERRLMPITDKFLHMDAMTIAMPSLAAQIYFQNSHFKSMYSKILVSGLLTVQTGLLYPYLAPVSGVAFFSSLISERSVDDSVSKSNKLIKKLIKAFLICLPVLLFYGGYIIMLFHDRSNSLIGLKPPPAVLQDIVNFIVIAGPFLILSEKQILSRRYRGIFLTVAFCFVVNAVVLGVNQYKFIYGAVICLLFTSLNPLANLLTAIGPIMKVQSIPSVRKITIVLFGLLFVIYCQNLLEHRPPKLNERPMLDEENFLIQSKNPDINRLLASHILNHSTIILSSIDEPMHLYLNIPEYFHVERNYRPGERNYRPGYSISYEDIITKLKGYAESDFRRRQEFANVLFFSGCDRSFLDSNPDLEARKILIFSERESDCLRNLREAGILSLLFQNESMIVYEKN